MRVLHDLAHPDRVSVSRAPAPLYQEEAAGAPVTGFRGSVADPIVTMFAMDSPFIGGAPRPEDVQQGDIGSCWLLSPMLSAVRDDPAYVRDMFTAWSANSVTVRLYRRDATGAHIPVLVTVDRADLAETSPGRPDPVGVATASNVHRLLDHEWYAQLAGGMLEVHRRDRYEVAPWPNLLEKAYARFVEAHGQYGGALLESGQVAAPNRNADGTVRSGYDVLAAGGYSNPVDEVFYGDRAAAGSTSVITSFTPGGDLVRANRAAIVCLALGNTTGTHSTDVSASLDDTELRARVSSSLAQVMVEPWLASHRELRAEFAYLQILLRQRGSVTSARLPAYDREIELAAAHATRPGAWPLLDGARAPASATALRELLVDLQNNSNNGPNDQQIISTRHSYAVARTTFRDATGAEVTVDPTAPDATLARLDGQRSTVRLHNPHGRDEADPRGTGPADGTDDGQFDLTLEQFLRHINVLEVYAHSR